MHLPRPRRLKKEARPLATPLNLGLVRDDDFQAFQRLHQPVDLRFVQIGESGSQLLKRKPRLIESPLRRLRRRVERQASAGTGEQEHAPLAAKLDGLLGPCVEVEPPPLGKRESDILFDQLALPVAELGCEAPARQYLYHPLAKRGQPLRQILFVAPA